MHKRSSTRTELAPVDERGHDDSCAHGCSTPRCWRHLIPEIKTCSPAPKKLRALLRSSFGQIVSFFSEALFLSVLGGISGWSYLGARTLRNWSNGELVLSVVAGLMWKLDCEILFFPSLKWNPTMFDLTDHHLIFTWLPLEWTRVR